MTARTAQRLGVKTVVGFTGSSIWKYVAMFPPATEEMVAAGYRDFADRWNPILDVFDECGVRFAHEVHPSEIAYDYWTTVAAMEAIEDAAPGSTERNGWLNPLLGDLPGTSPLQGTAMGNLLVQAWAAGDLAGGLPAIREVVTASTTLTRWDPTGDPRAWDQAESLLRDTSAARQ